MLFSKVFELEGGLRMVYRPVMHTRIVHCGLMIDAGSRDEAPETNGIAHFIEHTVFKGSEKRSSNQILRFLEEVGGEMNAFTTREKTCYYASVLKEHSGRAFDLLSDLVFHARFPEKELQKERIVIADEIDMYEDTPDESIYDDFYARLFGSHSLGYNILGTRESLAGLDGEKIRSFLASHYTRSNMVLSVCGNIDEKSALRLADKYLLSDSSATQRPERRQPVLAEKFAERVERDFTQAHCVMGHAAYSRTDERRFALSLLNNILGGSGMSSLLNLNVRERYGLTYHISSHYSTYEDTGVLTVYFGCDEKNVARCTSLVNKTMLRLCTQPLPASVVEKAKRQMIAQVAMNIENLSTLMQYDARTMLDYGRPYDYNLIKARLEAITPADLLAAANDILHPDRMSIYTYLPEGE